MNDTTITEKAAPYGFVRDGQVYLRAFSHYPERRIGEVKTTDEAALEYFMKRYETITEKIAEMERAIEETQNKGSYLMKIIHLKQHLEGYEAIGDFQVLLERLEKTEEFLRSLIVDNRKKNLEIKRSLLEEAQALKESTDYKTLFPALRDLKARWVKTGAIDPEFHEEVEVPFDQITDALFEQRKQYLEERHRQIEERLALFNALIERSRAQLAPDAHPAGAMKAIKEVDAAWREIGSVPKIYYAPLMDEFKNIKRKVIRNFKNFKQNTKPQQRPGQDSRPRREAPKVDFTPFLGDPVVKARLALIETAKSLQSLDLKTASNRVRELQNDWKMAGTMPDKIKNDLNNEFNAACDRITETSNLIRVVLSKHYFFKGKPKPEQLQIKIGTLQELIKKDEAEVEAQQEAYGKIPTTDRQLPDVKARYFRLMTAKRKLNMKRTLLGEMQKEQTQVAAPKPVGSAS